MPLINCPACKKQYSNIKDACPFCHYNPKEAALKQEIIQQAAVTLINNTPRKGKSQVAAAALAFFFWWIGADVFYTRGFFRGFIYLILIYVGIPSLLFMLPIWHEGANHILIPSLLAQIIAIGFVFIASVIRALYYLSLGADKFQAKYR